MILAIETSCDDTCAAVVDPADGAIRANVVSSQGVHDRYGGVVPEIAARHHLELLDLVVDDALAGAGIGLDDITRVAVTQGPGLVGALLIGVAEAKALAEQAAHSGAGTHRPWLAVGDGAVRFREQLVQAGVTVPEPLSPVHRVSAITVCRLGTRAEPAQRTEVVPDYLRRPDAEEALRARSAHG